MNKVYILFLTLIILSCQTSRRTSDTRLVGVVKENGMVVSAHPLASKVGSDILQAGGNAWDAAVAVQFALAVTYPVAGNLGGGGFAVYRATDGTVGALDFREKAPQKAHRDMYLDDAGDIIDGLSLRGHLASGVPGSVSGMVALHEKHGKLDWKKLIQPSIDLARNGFPITEGGAGGFNRSMETFDKLNTFDLPIVTHGEWEEGDLFQQEALARTLERIRDLKNEGFYGGETARLIVEEMQRGGGMISYDDLRQYQSVWRDPLTTDYRGYKVITMAPPSSGGVALIQLLEGIESYNVSGMQPEGARKVHLMAEIERRVYADRAEHLGDPDFYGVPVQTLTDENYVAMRMQDIDLKKATLSSDIRAGEILPYESMETTHFSIVDKEGNAVSITTTLNSGYGSKVMVKDAGFFLNNEMDDFSIKPGVPNQFGLVGGIANQIHPGKRMLSSMTPTILEQNGDLAMVVGTPGGSTIITSVFQTILNVVDHGMSMQEAVNFPRIHHQWLPDRILIEKNALNEDIKSKLMDMGHKIDQRNSIGRVDAILVLKDGSFEGAGDPRGEDTAVGF